MLDGLRDWVPDILFFGIPSLAGAVLFIWRDGALRRRGVTVRAQCVNQARNKDGAVALQLRYEADGAQYTITTQHYRFPPTGIGQAVEIIYDPVHPWYGQMTSELGRGIVPWFVGGIASILLVLAGISCL
ncbi:hypothetical protein [Streptomyces sp. NPDC058755]|uniref:hypothetical protein n=1 Tax=Streptomyces sp. NPDC058755 TaxID=3346624 RepID=UPI0036A42EB6